MVAVHVIREQIPSENPPTTVNAEVPIPSHERPLHKLVKSFGQKIQDLKICHEAGTTGFFLARCLIQLGVSCYLIDPSKTERKATESNP